MKMTRRKSRAEVPSMAMGDIAFNLLIFFVILARAQDDSHLKWDPAQTPEVESSGNSRVSVVIDIRGDKYLNGKQIGNSELASSISDLLGDTPAGERVVLLKVHRETTALTFEPVIEAVSEAGGDLVHILEKEN